MVHEYFSDTLWQKRCPLELIETNQPRLFQGTQITSPAELLAVCETRARLPIFQEVSSVPTDIFLFGLGEPKIPHITKVGGVPFRPLRKHWPEYAGKKMIFLAQFCFSDSLDLFSFPLPGNLLVIFYIDFPNIEQDTHYHYEWYNWETIDEPMSRSDISEDVFLRADFQNNFASWYGVKYRTIDYPSAQSFLPTYSKMKYVKKDHLDCRLQGYEIYDDKQFSKLVACNQTLRYVDVLDGTKIGGTDPFYFTEKIIKYYGNDVIKNNHFLCSLASITPVYSLSPKQAIPYPFVNYPEPFTSSKDACCYRLNIFDGGRFHFYISDNGEVFCEWST